MVLSWLNSIKTVGIILAEWIFVNINRSYKMFRVMNLLKLTGTLNLAASLINVKPNGSTKPKKRSGAKTLMTLSDLERRDAGNYRSINFVDSFYDPNLAAFLASYDTHQLTDDYSTRVNSYTRFNENS